MKKVLCLCLAVLLCVSLSSFSAFAADDDSAEPSVHDLFLQASQQIEDAAKAAGLEIGVLYTYTSPEGDSQDYYLDEGYNPYYIDENGEKVWLVLPLPHLAITDERLLNIIEGNAVASPFEWQPSSYHDLGNGAYTVSNFNFEGENIFQTPILKLWRNSPSVRVHTKDFPLFSGYKHFISFVWYSSVDGASTRTGMLRGTDGLGIDCRKVARIQCTTVERFVRLSMIRADNVKSCTVEITSEIGQT